MRVSILLVSMAVCGLPAGLAGQGTTGCNQAGNVRFVCGQQAPEDLVVLPGSQWVAASVFTGAGGINLINVRDKTTTLGFPGAAPAERLDAKTYDTCPGPPDAADKAKFSTHGLAVRAGRGSNHTLYAVHHGARESIEVFNVDMRGKTPVLTWVGCAIAPDPIGLNSVVALPDGGFIATNFRPRNADEAARARMLAGENNGELWEWHTGKGWAQVPGSQASGPNGVEVSKDGKWLYVAAWGSQSFFRLSRGQTPAKRDAIPLGFRVDNVRWAPDGSILAAGQDSTVPDKPTSNVVRIDPSTLKVQELVRHPNSADFGFGTVAVQIGKDLWVGSFRSDRVAIFPVP